MTQAPPLHGPYHSHSRCIVQTVPRLHGCKDLQRHKVQAEDERLREGYPSQCSALLLASRNLWTRSQRSWRPRLRSSATPTPPRYPTHRDSEECLCRSAALPPFPAHAAQGL